MTATEIKKLFYTKPITSLTKAESGLTAAEVKALLADKTNLKEIKNVHGDTFQYEESEASVTRYKNALTGKNYRESREPGEASMSFTIGEYDFETKADLQGGKADDSSWERGDDEAIYKCVIGKTKDGVYIVFPNASISGRGANTDKAIGLAVKATPMETNVTGLAPEKWFKASEIDATE